MKEKYSLKLWWKKNNLWFIKNKDTIKALLSAFFALLSFQYSENIWIQLLFGATGGYASRLMLDFIDFHFVKK
jgi:hypothetical protein